jgi:hypothetical protein
VAGPRARARVRGAPRDPRRADVLAKDVLAKVAARADVEGNHVADALAEIGAERRDDVLDVPAALDGAGAGRARLATPALQLRYLPRHA